MSSDFSPYYPRDFQGYGNDRPDPQWPDGARVAISLVQAVEAGAELSVADGDERNETIYEIDEPVQGVPNAALASHFDYGPRVGYWRLNRILEKYGLPCSFTAAGRAIEKMPWIAKDIVARGHEIYAHGYRWEGHANMAEDEERAAIARTVKAIEDACGVKPLGWHTKGAPSPNTRRLLAEAGFEYDCDVYDDDLPHMLDVDGKPFVLVPYGFDTNDMRFQGGGTFGSFVTADDYARVCIDAFDTLWEEGASHPAMMTVCMHPHYIARPSRIRGLTDFLDHVHAKGGAWFATRLEIARHWRATFGQ